jgi:hypothetical protein
MRPRQPCAGASCAASPQAAGIGEDHYRGAAGGLSIPPSPTMASRVGRVDRVIFCQDFEALHECKRCAQSRFLAGSCTCSVSARQRAIAGLQMSGAQGLLTAKSRLTSITNVVIYTCNRMVVRVVNQGFEEL